MPMSSSRSLAGSCFWFHGAESMTRSPRPNGVRSGAPEDRNAIRSSIFQAPSSRASSSTSPARVTAGLGSHRNSPGARTGTGGPGAGTMVCPPGRIVARRPAVAMAGDQATASFRSRPTAMNSSSQPAGTASWGRPGAVLMPAEPPRPAWATHQDRGGSLSPARIRLPPLRRAGSMNTASTPRRPMSRTSAQTARTLPAAPYTPALACAMRRWSGSMLTASTGWSWAKAIRSPPIPQHRSATGPAWA